jgi:hypothetical protein
MAFSTFSSPSKLLTSFGVRRFTPSSPPAPAASPFSFTDPFPRLSGLSYILIDRYQLNSLLTRSERHRLITDDPTNAFPGDAREEAIVEEKGWMLRPSKPWTVAGLGTGAAMTVAAWVVYLIYSQGS